MSKRTRQTAFEDPSHAPYAIVGTPLPPLDSNTRDDGSYVPPWQQEVLDDRGRKRLHGAFTGGFSAGYFNTVGSKEGWTPSTFTSSRAKKDGERGERKGQRVEDFMDEEDLREREEGRAVETVDAFAGLGGGNAGKDGGGMFGSLFRVSAGDTIGVRLLQKMGWKVGQGIGPKVRRRARGDKSGELHLFAPEDSRVIEMGRKKDRRGLGFAGEERLGVGDEAAGIEGDESERDATIMQANRPKVLVQPKQKLKKTGFGVGILNDTGSDEDEDAYDMGPRISYSRILGGDKKNKKKKGGLVSTNAKPTVQKPIFTTSKTLAQRQTSLAGFRKCHDGRLPLEGFILTTAPLAVLQENNYPPPLVPEGWKPSRLAQSASNTATLPYQSTADAARSSTLTPSTRANLLGEAPLPGKSIFAYLTPTARDSIASATNKLGLPAALSEKAPAGFEAASAENQRKRLWDLVPELDPETAQAALERGWMPYAEDDGKRDRYRGFLALSAGQQGEAPTLPVRPQGMGVEEWGRELSEFAQAASVFRPVGGVMSRRFISSSGTEGYVEKANGLETDASARKMDAAAKEDDPAEKAARLGMFGPLTRVRQVFAPTRLLCKRFNVKVPANVGEERQSGKTTAGSGREDGGAGVRFKPAGFISAGVEGGGEEVDSEPLRKPAEVRAMPGAVDAERNEALEGQRAGEAVFKAIFGSDDDDDD